MGARCKPLRPGISFQRTALLLGAMSAALIGGPALAEKRANYFNDPFLRVTEGIADCPVPEGPMITQAEMRIQAHVRIERGTRCFLSGRCRLPNSYLYDKEIIPRVEKADRKSTRLNSSH